MAWKFVSTSGICWLRLNTVNLSQANFRKVTVTQVLVMFYVLICNQVTLNRTLTLILTLLLDILVMVTV